MKPHLTKTGGGGWYVLQEHRGPDAWRMFAGATLEDAITFLIDLTRPPPSYLTDPWFTHYGWCRS